MLYFQFWDLNFLAPSNDSKVWKASNRTSYGLINLSWAATWISDVRRLSGIFKSSISGNRSLKAINKLKIRLFYFSPKSFCTSEKNKYSIFSQPRITSGSATATILAVIYILIDPPSKRPNSSALSSYFLSTILSSFSVLKLFSIIWSSGWLEGLMYTFLFGQRSLITSDHAISSSFTNIL